MWPRNPRGSGSAQDREADRRGNCREPHRPGEGVFRAIVPHIAHHKASAVAEVLLASPRSASEVLTVQTLKSLRIHPAFAALVKEGGQTAYAVMEVQAKTFASKLGFAR
jgi:hypothetical protein